jgi:hypothetical protein
VSVGPGERVSKDFHDGAIDAWRQYFLYLEEGKAGRRSSGAVGQWGREEEQIGAIKGCEYPSIGQSDEQRYGGKGTGLYQSLPINPSTIM